MVKRYDIFGPAQSEEIKDDGEWVKHEDFEKLQTLFLEMLEATSIVNGYDVGLLIKKEYDKIVGDK